MGNPSASNGDNKTEAGVALLDHPGLNKDTAFTQAEREKHGLVGLLPDAVENLDRQFQRATMQLAQKESPLDEYIYLNGLYEYNETLFFKVVMSDPKRFLPIVYDPTVAEACIKFGHIYRRAQGMYLSIKHKGKVKEVLKNWPVKDVRFICISSGGRILGLGDIGTNGMGSQGNFELNAMRPIIINNFLHSARILGDGCQKFREYSVEGTKLNKEKIEKYVGESVMLVTALSPVTGYDKASKIAHQAMDTGSTLKEAALKNGVSAGEYDKVVNPREMAGHGVGEA